MSRMSRFKAWVKANELQLTKEWATYMAYHERNRTGEGFETFEAWALDAYNVYTLLERV